MRPPLRIERVPVDGTTRDVLGTLGLPANAAERLARFSAPLIRTALVARYGGEVTGAAVTVSRPLASYLKIGGVWERDPSDAGVRQALTAAAEDLAWESGFAVVKREYVADEPGWVTVAAPEFGGPVPDPAPSVTAAQFKWRSRAGRTTVPYMRQTTDITCGPAALSMLLAREGIIDRPARATELALWRQAATVSGDSGCDPYGLAVTANGRGLRPAVVISTGDTLFLEDLKTDQDRELMRFVQDGFKRQAGDAGIEVRRGTFDMEELAGVVRAGGAALVLVDELLVHGDRCPHWILVHGMADGCFLAHDPWTEVSQGETWVDGYDVPLPAASLDRMAWTGEPPARAMLIFPARV